MWQYPPGVDGLLNEFYEKWRNREIKLCSLQTLHAFLRQQKEAKAKWHFNNEMKRMSTAQLRSAPDPAKATTANT